MSEQIEEVEVTGAEPPEDFEAFEAWRDAGHGAVGQTDDEEAPPAGDKQPPSESAEAEEDDVDQTAAESDSEEDAEQEAEEPQEPQGKANKGIAKRMRTLTGEIAKLKAQLAARQSPSEEAEADEEVASSQEDETAEVTDQEEPAVLVRPKLADFEDSDELTAWEQYEAALDEYHEAKTAKLVEKALETVNTKSEEKLAKTMADREWDRAAARYPDFNEGLEKVQISSAMESVMRMDPVAGTDLVFYLKQHPEDSQRIATATLATNEREWNSALARAGMELGQIRAKIAKSGGALPPGVKPTSKPAPNQTKKVTSASRPTTQLRNVPVAPRVDILSDEDAQDYNRWEAAREKQLKSR